MKFLIVLILIFPHSLAYYDLETVPNFNLTKYIGHWYLISSYASFVHFYCICNQADYFLDSNNPFNVKFDEYCRILSPLAPYKHTFSHAEFEESSPAKWTVYNDFIGVITLNTEYWIIGLDDENYEWALVGARNRQNLYVYSRNQTLSDNLYDKILEIATEKHFDRSKLIKTNQNCID